MSLLTKIFSALGYVPFDELKKGDLDVYVVRKQYDDDLPSKELISHDKAVYSSGVSLQERGRGVSEKTFNPAHLKGKAVVCPKRGLMSIMGNVSDVMVEGKYPMFISDDEGTLLSHHTLRGYSVSNGELFGDFSMSKNPFLIGKIFYTGSARSGKTTLLERHASDPSAPVAFIGNCAKDDRVPYSFESFLKSKGYEKGDKINDKFRRISIGATSDSMYPTLNVENIPKLENKIRNLLYMGYTVIFEDAFVVAPPNKECRNVDVDAHEDKKTMEEYNEMVQRFQKSTLLADQTIVFVSQSFRNSGFDISLFDYIYMMHSTTSYPTLAPVLSSLSAKNADFLVYENNLTSPITPYVFHDGRSDAGSTDALTQIEFVGGVSRLMFPLSSIQRA